MNEHEVGDLEWFSSYYKISKSLARQMANNGEVPCIKLGKRVIRFNKEEVKSHLNKTSEVLK